MQTKEEVSRPPGYYIRSKLFQNVPAMISLAIICLSVVITLLGYLILPDSTPNVNDGAMQIQKQSPGFKLKLLKLRKNREIERRNIFERAISGQESDYMILPVTNVEVEGMTITATVFGKNDYYSQYNLLDAVMPLGLDSSNLISQVPADGILKYIDIYGKRIRCRLFLVPMA